jgi:hypothetical protein
MWKLKDTKIIDISKRDMSHSQILQELQQEEQQLVQELARYQPKSRAAPRRAPAAQGASLEEKVEIRKARSRIAYKKKQLQKYSAPQQQQQEQDEEPEQEFVPIQRTQARPPAKRAPAKKSKAVPAQLPPAPQQQEAPQGRGIQMVYCPGDGDDRAYETEQQEEDDDEEGFSP